MRCHRLLEVLQVLGGERLGHVEVVVEAVGDRRTDAELRVGVRRLDGLRQHVRGRVPQDRQALLRLDAHRFERCPLSLSEGRRQVQVADLSVHPLRPRRSCRRRTGPGHVDTPAPLGWVEPISRPGPPSLEAIAGGRHSGSRPMKPSIRVCTSASSGTGTAGPYCPESRMDLLDALHAGQQLGAEVRVQPVVLTGRPSQVPGVHEDVGGVDPVDQIPQRHASPCAGRPPFAPPDPDRRARPGRRPPGSARRRPDPRPGWVRRRMAIPWLPDR